jgi:hypothetical protein
MTFASPRELRAFLDGARIASTLKHDRPTEQPSETERAAQVLAVLREGSAI